MSILKILEAQSSKMSSNTIKSDHSSAEHSGPSTSSYGTYSTFQFPEYKRENYAGGLAAYFHDKYLNFRVHNLEEQNKELKKEKLEIRTQQRNDRLKMSKLMGDNHDLKFRKSIYKNRLSTAKAQIVISNSEAERWKAESARLRQRNVELEMEVQALKNAQRINPTYRHY